jgi:O-antigen ligase
MTLTRATSASFAAAFFFLPLSKPATFAALGVAALLLGVELRREHGAVPRRLPPWAGAIAVLAVLPFVSLLVHADGAGNLVYLSQGYYWLLPFLVFAGARRADVAGWLAAFLGGTALAWIHLRLESLGIRLLPAQPAALGNYILTSQFLAMGLVATAMLHRHDPRPLARAAYWAIAAAMAWGVATGPGRTGLIVVLVLMPLVASAMLPRRGVAIVALACTLGAVGLLSSPMVQTRIAQVAGDIAHWRASDGRAAIRISADLDNSVGLRLEMWRTAGAVLAEHPVLGGGPQAFHRAWRQRFDEPETRFIEPHSAYLFYAAAHGLPGLLALLAFVVALMRTGWRHRARLAGGTTLCFGLAVAISGLTNTLIMGTTSTQMLMLFAGLAGALWPAKPAAASRSAR